MIAKYIVLSNIISVVSDNICVFVFKNPSWYQKNIVLLHTLSAYNSLLVRYKVYSSDPRECLCTSWRYAEVYENFSTDPAPCRKNPIKKYTCHTKLSALITIINNYTWRKWSWNTYKPWVIYDLLNLPSSLLISFSETIDNLLWSEQLARN